MTHTIYTPSDLQREARAMCKGFGRFVGWELRIGDRAQLIAKFVRHYNPNRPLAQQAIEQHSMAL